MRSLMRLLLLLLLLHPRALLLLLLLLLRVLLTQHLRHRVGGMSELHGTAQHSTAVISGRAERSSAVHVHEHSD